MGVCIERGCPKLATSRGRCGDHGTSYDQRRGTSSERGYNTSRWRNYRASWLATFPLCGQRDGTPTTDSRCLETGRVTAATVVDHITPVHGETDPLFYQPSNHQSLCASCHSAKTRRDMQHALTRRTA